MTPVGIFILNLLTEAFDPKYKSNYRKLLSHKESKVLSLLYNFEDNTFPSYKDIAKGFGLTAERIRQLQKRGLKKIGAKGRKLRDDYPICRLIRFIKYKMEREQIDAYEAITTICQYDLEDVPYPTTVSLLANIYFEKKEDRTVALGYLKRKQKAQQREEVRRSNQLQRSKEEFNKILELVIWFDHIKTWPKNALEGKIPKRKVNQNDRYKSGIFKSTKCNKEIQFESGVELDFIRKLENAPQVVSFLEQPVTVYYNKSGIEHTYTPDFAVLLENGRCFIVERKNLDEMMDARVHRRMEALIEFCEKHGMGLLLTDGKNSIGRLKTYPFNETFEQELIDKLSERNGRTMFYNEYKEIMEKYKATKMEFLAIVLKNKWTYYSFKFKLSPKSTYSVFRKKIVDKL